MPIQIEINDSHVDGLIEFYLQRIKVLRTEIAEREKESKDINAQILRLKRGKTESIGNEKSPIIHSTSNYHEKWTWIKKIRFILEPSLYPMTTKEIVDTLMTYEAGLMFDRKKAIASVSSILSTKSGEGKEFLRLENESGDFAYDIKKKKNVKDDNDDDINPFE
ncbi:MAG: hypothetical protein P0Y53_15420 [Candidatus Pseudobacter hemicellulosilyticus]|uniref:Uncharacterized protein n=1 Tax=Candidatus Pseudobacter hemicellulosilyticus TaxID=3121375 RepID=A0AAJ5WNY0_9BACT|nr:MAG: hypothetical protein P0Y53_15420 [Pseudobacter sp.]